MGDDNSEYSSPMPIVGLYSAVATSVCFFLMFLDVLAGFRSKKLWFPLKYFSLNSVTLTLLSIATKIPVDLTSPMSRVQDQLSKLTGTTFICISIGFLMPSVGKNRKYESLSNMVALTIFVFTVVANICTQIYTGLISKYIVEHVFILCSMLALLSLIWVASRFSDVQKKGSVVDRNKALLKTGKESFFDRLKMCYVHGYKTNPQLFLAKHLESTTGGSICLLCLVVLAQAIFRTPDLKFSGKKDSDYGWSMWIIVSTQILFVLIGGVATCFRKFTDVANHPEDKAKIIIAGNPILISNKGSLWERCLYTVRFLYLWLGYLFTVSLFAVPDFLFMAIFKCIRRVFFQKNDENRSRGVEEFNDLKDDGQWDSKLGKWAISKGTDDMNKLMTASQIISPKNLIELFSDTSPSEISLTDGLDSNKDHGLLSMILLVRIAMVSLPTSLSPLLFETLKETYEIIRFIEKRISSSTSQSKMRSKITKAAWQYMNYKDVSDGNIMRSEVDLSLGAIKELLGKMPKDIVQEELETLVKVIADHKSSTTEEFSDFIKRLFINLLHKRLRELPNSIYKYIIESPVEEYEERLRRAMTFFCKVKPLGTRVQWVFPPDSNISCLISADVHVPGYHRITISENGTPNAEENDSAVLLKSSTMDSRVNSLSRSKTERHRVI